MRNRIKDNHALRVEFIRSVINLPGGDDNDALAVGTLLSFIKGTAVRTITAGDEYALRAYLSEAVRLRGLLGSDTEALTQDIAGLAQRIAEGETPLVIPMQRDIREVG